MYSVPNYVSRAGRRFAQICVLFTCIGVLLAGSTTRARATQRWFTGSWTQRTGDDATMINHAAGHPNNLGYAHIANPLEADLRPLAVRKCGARRAMLCSRAVPGHRTVLGS